MNDTSTQPRREPRGAVEHTGVNGKFIHIKYGCLCEVSKTPIEGWMNPVNQKTGEVIPDKWIKVYKSLEVWIDKLEWYQRTHGQEEYLGWKMHASAGGIHYILDLPLNSEATKKFMMSARNIDYDVPLEVAAWTSRDDGKLAVWFKQNDKSVLQYYKKGDMKECPSPTQKLGIGGKAKWDWDATDAYLHNEMQNMIAPHIEKCAADRGYTAPAPAPAPTATDLPTHSGPAGAIAAEDDIPF